MVLCKLCEEKIKNSPQNSIFLKIENIVQVVIIVLYKLCEEKIKKFSIGYPD